MRDDARVYRESFWRGGRLRAAAVIGVPAGVYFGLFALGDSGDVRKALGSGVFFGVFLGGWMSWYLWRSWPAARDLRAGDRGAIMRAVMRGEGVTDRRLAPYVIERSENVRTTHERDRRYAWMMPTFAVLALVFTVIAIVDGGTIKVLTWLAVLALYAVNLRRIPDQRERLEINAERAEMLARRQLETDQ